MSITTLRRLRGAPLGQCHARLSSRLTAASGSPSFTRDSPTRIAPHPVPCTNATCSGVKMPLSPAIRKPLFCTCATRHTMQPSQILQAWVSASLSYMHLA